MKIGIFGGSFDPVHVGHLVVACDARHQQRLDRVLVVPTARPPHKPERELVPIGDRLAMVRLAIAGVPGLEACDVEVREEVAYTVETLRWAARTYDDPELFLVIGEDSLGELCTWREPEEIVRLATLLVYPRSGADTSRDLRHPRHVRLDGERIDVSSSQLRERLARGAPIRFLVPDAVRRYIGRHGLYRAGAAC